MAHKRTTVEAVKRAYVHEQLPLEQAAKRHAVPIGTARRWMSRALADGDDWDKLKAAALLAGGGMEGVSRAILMGFMVQYQSTMDALNNDAEMSPFSKVQALASLSDAFNKTVAASRRVLPETSKQAVAIDVIERMAVYVQVKYPEALPVFVELLDGFGREIEAAYQ